ncbi:MAG: serine/threonine protein kinase [Steroidobacteraceae bacterium]
MTENWTKWESQVIDGAFPLRRLLGTSDHSAVFLTEHTAQALSDAAIKLVPVDPALAEAQLARWRRAATLSHPHLLRLLDSGRCQLGGRSFLFLVMEHAAETLSQILPHRALTCDEVRDMLRPTLDALAFLHRQNLVQGQLKPPNILVVNDQVKLASDTIRPAGGSAPSTSRSSLYDPPEATGGRISAAGDIWGLGVTLVEALTQCPPAWPDQRAETPTLPTTLPLTFVDTVRRCLSRNPANRPAITDFEAQLKPPGPQTVPAAPQTVVREAPAARPIPPPEPPPQRSLVPAIVVVLILLGVVWGGLRLVRPHSNTAPTAATSSPSSTQQDAAAASASQAPDASVPTSSGVSGPSPDETVPVPGPPPSRNVSRPSNQPSQPRTDASLTVVHEEIPDVARSARDTIRGHIKISVQVTVDRSGNVVRAVLGNPGPSRYFARLATAAAKKWKFAPADNQDSREGVLWFDFARGGITGHAAAPRS